MIDRMDWQLPEEFICYSDRREHFPRDPNYYSWYYTYGWKFKPERILEIGVRLGYSLMSICSGVYESGGVLKAVRGVDSEIHTVDSNARATSNLKRGRFDFLDVRIDNKRSDVVNIADYSAPFDLVHVDADHGEGFPAEFDAAWECVASGGVMIVDDCGSKHCWKLRRKVPQMKMIQECVANKIFDGTAESSTWVQSFTGHIILKKV